MPLAQPDLYQQWRSRRARVDSFQESTQPSRPAERLLQQVWRQQRLRRDQLVTLDGRPLTVLHPGFWNREAGPDFRDAVLQFGGGAPISGDVEIDLIPAGWKQHGHDSNPSYRKVALHVVWDTAGAIPHQLPVLHLPSALDAPIDELALWLGGNSDSLLPEILAGHCCAPLRGLTSAALDELLLQAARARLRAKSHQFLARARQAGWDQALWEGLFTALGYKHNSWPMRRIAELLPLRATAGAARDALELQAWLLGVGGLLPSQLSREESGTYLRRLWDCWWRMQDQYRPRILPRAAWRFHGLRPANRPERRLGLASHWLAEGTLPDKLEKWLLSPVRQGDLLDSCMRLLTAPADEFWSSHWTLQSPRLANPQPLLGPQRATDIAMNVLLPWLCARVGTAGDQSLLGVIEERYFTWPAGEDNSVLKLIRSRLFTTQKPVLPRTAANQQALLQVARDFCGHSNALCQDCEFPALVAQIASLR